MIVRAYRVESKDLNIIVVARDVREAWIKFFKWVYEHWSEAKHKIGQLAVARVNGETYAIRTIPTLLNLNLIDRETAIENIQHVIQGTRREAEQLLDFCLEEDKWIAEEVKE